MKEKDFQREFHKWCKYNWQGSAAFELKLCKDKSMPFSAVQPHQLIALDNAKNGKIFYKIPDDSVGQKPFDCFILNEVSAFVVIMFYELGQKEFVLIDVNTYMNEMILSTRKSLTKERAYKIGKVYKLGEKLYA